VEILHFKPAAPHNRHVIHNNIFNTLFIIILQKIINVIIRQIVLEETIIKVIEQNQLTWYGHVQKMAK